MPDENTPKDIIIAVTELVKTVPIYQDALQPAAKQLGHALETVGKVVNLVLEPFVGLVWGYERIKGYVQTSVAEKLASTPPSEIQAPAVNVAGPAMEALRYAGHEPTLRELYSNLLAASMDKKTATTAHPAFVEFIKQITPDEAKLMGLFQREQPFPVISVIADVTGTFGGSVVFFRRFSLLGYQAGCEYPLQTPSYLDNLERLGLIHFPELSAYTTTEIYWPLEQHPELKLLINHIDSQPSHHHSFKRHAIEVTQLGRLFIRACILDHSSARIPSNATVAVPNSVEIFGNLNSGPFALSDGYIGAGLPTIPPERFPENLEQASIKAP